MQMKIMSLKHPSLWQVDFELVTCFRLRYLLVSAGLACWPELGGLGLSGDWVAVKRQPKIYIATQTELLCKRCILQ